MLNTIIGTLLSVVAVIIAVAGVRGDFNDNVPLLIGASCMAAVSFVGSAYYVGNIRFPRLTWDVSGMGRRVLPTLAWIGVSTIAGMSLYAPWYRITVREYTFHKDVTYREQRDPVRYSWVFDPPVPYDQSVSYYLDYSRLFVQWVAVGLPTLGLFMASRRRSKL